MPLHAFCQSRRGVVTTNSVICPCYFTRFQILDMDGHETMKTYIFCNSERPKTSRRGENRASVLSVFEKKCRVRHSETADSFPQIGLKNPREFEMFSWWWTVIYSEFVPEKVRDVFFRVTSPYGSSRRDQWAPKDLWSWSSSNAIATPWCFASVLGPHGCDCGRKTTWHGRF